MDCTAFLFSVLFPTVYSEGGFYTVDEETNQGGILCILPVFWRKESLL